MEADQREATIDEARSLMEALAGAFLHCRGFD